MEYHFLLAKAQNVPLARKRVGAAWGPVTPDSAPMAASQPVAPLLLAQRSLRRQGAPWGILPRPGALGRLCESCSGPCLLPRGPAFSRQPKPRN